jgi:hypothetical protein
LQALFINKGGLACRDAADSDDSGQLDVGDAIYALNFLFLNGQRPRPPFPSLGFDPTVDELDCR